jgi:hypothetical protein
MVNDASSIRDIQGPSQDLTRRQALGISKANSFFPSNYIVLERLIHLL